MFTLKLFRRQNGQLSKKIIVAHHIQVMEIGQNKRTLEIWVFRSEAGGDYDTYYVGEKEDGMDVLSSFNHWGWGLLENGEGNTTEHFRPAGYG